MESVQESSKMEIPFGPHDGARADIKDILGGFVDFSDMSFGGISMSDKNYAVRVFVGRKGSGKTVYMRRVHAAAKKEKSIYSETYKEESIYNEMYVAQIQQNLPSTECVIKFSQWFPEPTLTEKWRELWRRALLRSIFSHLMYAEPINHILSPEEKERLKKEYKNLLSKATTPMSAYSQVTYIINSHKSAKDFNNFCEDELWESLEYVLGQILKDAPPFFLFIDAIDDEFAHAPMYWLRCQKGLFYQVMKFMKSDSAIGSRLHIFICIREIVYGSILRSEHAMRYTDSYNIRILKWTKALLSG